MVMPIFLWQFVYHIAGNFRGYSFSLFSQIDFVPQKLKPPNFNL